MEPGGEKVKKIAGDLNVRLPLTTYVCGSGLSLPGYIRRERPSTPSAHMALTRPVVPPDGSLILGMTSRMTDKPNAAAACGAGLRDRDGMTGRDARTDLLWIIRLRRIGKRCASASCKSMT
ncbi:hypothetical protein [Bradyrhizobium tropiciagri]|uniref:hypothetical protein n=1 Tax=Bradyrhizobium tropiciagri TaxID=312253 RepID=UPI001009ABA9|nr:hypothetical protein [Bradyrhizobium tropiciagri]